MLKGYAGDDDALAANSKLLRHHGSIFFDIIAFKALDCYFDFLTRL
jgi:hypothetical protein